SSGLGAVMRRILRRTASKRIFRAFVLGFRDRACRSSGTLGWTKVNTEQTPSRSATWRRYKCGLAQSDVAIRMPIVTSRLVSRVATVRRLYNKRLRRFPGPSSSRPALTGSPFWVDVPNDVGKLGGLKLLGNGPNNLGEVQSTDDP